MRPVEEVLPVSKRTPLRHDLRLMQKWKFLVSLPLWDLVRGTYVRKPT